MNMINDTVIMIYIFSIVWLLFITVFTDGSGKFNSPYIPVMPNGLFYAWLFAVLCPLINTVLTLITAWFILLEVFSGKNNA